MVAVKPDWRHFQTAPLDGTKILLFGFGLHREIVVGYYRKYIGKVWVQLDSETQKLVPNPGEEWCYANSATPIMFGNPTHWAPLIDLTPDGV